MTIPLAVAVALSVGPWSPQNPPELAPLGAAERAALATIDERGVRATVAFLACDELAGRDTPSPGLRVAAAYVASRFAGAGLEGLGAAGSYYLPAELALRAVPVTGVTLTDGQAQPLAHHGLLAAGERALDYQGPLFDAGTGLPRGGASPYPDEGVAGAVLATEPSAERARPGWPAGFALLAPLRRQVREAQRRGATALLLKVADDSPLLAMVAEVRQPAMRSRLGFAGMPILLVPESFASAAIALHAPAQRTTTAEVRNVCGVLRGADPERADEAIVISAHLDHIGVGSGGADRIRNGADDDATGVTAVLALADAFAALSARPARSVLFVTFWGEEKGLRGSRHFCANPPWPLDDVVANINLEMLGRPEEGARHKAWMTGWTHSDLGELMARGAARVGVEVFRHERLSPRLYGASDNASFVAKGVVAHSFSAGSLHDDYHQPGDEWTKLDLPHMTRVIQGLFAGALPLARGQLTPRRAR